MGFSWEMKAILKTFRLETIFYEEISPFESEKYYTNEPFYNFLKKKLIKI